MRKRLADTGSSAMIGNWVVWFEETMINGEHAIRLEIVLDSEEQRTECLGEILTGIGCLGEMPAEPVLGERCPDCDQRYEAAGAKVFCPDCD